MKYIKYNYKYMLFTFFLISIFAWGLELSYSCIINNKFRLPGVLFGPWCPIYGFTALILMLLVNEKDKMVHNFFKIFVVAMIVEYISSFISEKVFNRIIWDYSKFALNINGRVCIQMSIIFSVLGLLFIYDIKPLIKRIYDGLGFKIKLINLEFLFLFICDIILTVLSR